MQKCIANLLKHQADASGIIIRLYNVAAEGKVSALDRSGFWILTPQLAGSESLGKLGNNLKMALWASVSQPVPSVVRNQDP